MERGVNSTVCRGFVGDFLGDLLGDLLENLQEDFIGNWIEVR
jgi:hypothetical protein